MNLEELRELQAKFEKQKDELHKDFKELNRLRQKFVKKYSIDKIESLSLDNYVIGKQGNTFCNQIENELQKLGDIHGSFAIKFGIYYGKEGKDKEKKYRFAKIKFGVNVDEAFQKVKESIVALIKAGEKNDFNTIISNPISPMFRGKILSIYFPEKYLNIFATSHLNHFINALSLSNTSKIELDKQKILIDYKNKDEIMQDWNIYTFTNFLYFSFGKPVKNNKKLNQKLKNILS